MNEQLPVPLKEEEEVLLMVRESLVPHAPRFVLYTVLLCIPLFFSFPLLKLGWGGVLVWGIAIMACVVALIRAYRAWKDTMLVVTDRRIVDIERTGLFEKAVCEAEYEEIDEVTFRVKGVVPTVCRYGTIEVKTAGNAADIAFIRAPRPADVHEMIADARRSALERPVTRKERRARTIAKRMTDEDMDAWERSARVRDQQQALRAVFDDEDE